jgi:cysteinyl-tRNA synthetase
MHNGMLASTDGEKMSKSVGNITPLHEVLDDYGRDTVILYFAGAHYRQPIAYGAEQLEAARAAVARIREAAHRLVAGESPAALRLLRDRFFAALEEDFNTPAALAAMWEWIRQANRSGVGEVGDGDLREMLGVLGLENLFEVAGAPAEAVALAAARQRARESGDYAQADELRARIEAAGWSVRDTPGGFELAPLS